MSFKILIDDFGTGYSKLSYLKHYAIDTLKIDRSFVKDVVSDENDAAIVTAIVAMAQSLKMNVIVETEEQVDFYPKRGVNTKVTTSVNHCHRQKLLKNWLKH